MPEFTLNTGIINSDKIYKNLSELAQGYIEAMFFTSTGPDNEKEGLSSETNLSEFAPGQLEAIGKMVDDWRDKNCKSENKEDLIKKAIEKRNSNYDETRAGNDLWYTSQGHGTGFWDRNLGTFGEQLTQKAKILGENGSLYRGDDNQLWFSGLNKSYKY